MMREIKDMLRITSLMIMRNHIIGSESLTSNQKEQ